MICIKTRSKKAFTLVELIFSIVIIAIVFTVIPRLMFATTKTMELSIKEDGLFSAMALMGNIIRLPWDSNTLSSNGKILDTSANTCTDYRVGGFLGSRNCLNSNLSASTTFILGPNFDSINNYHNYTTTTISPLIINGIDYNLKVQVSYVNPSLISVGSTQELKEVRVDVNTSERVSLCSSFFYYSANLGHIQINKRVW